VAGDTCSQKLADIELPILVQCRKLISLFSLDGLEFLVHLLVTSDTNVELCKKAGTTELAHFDARISMKRLSHQMVRHKG
jgi:hypothetical protein